MKLAGEWRATSVRFQVYEAGVLVSDESEDFDDYLLVLNSDGTGHVNAEGKSSDIRWDVTGTRFSFSSRSDSDDLMEEEYEIVSIEGGKMILTSTDNYDYWEIPTKEVLTFTFRKI